ncbi:MAG: glycosyltransferase family 39 protein [Candidatus Accumulibacter sp.]|uniref:Glycosyltransferase family 39 protein n=1 Tax=Candidatus Accumulibacter affinis TaxID=2954384 RepID=A0A935W435_9PROT|nr:glycosyltransferase family 39 protein [Candidatus Accumulibacter affinis]
MPALRLLALRAARCRSPPLLADRPAAAIGMNSLAALVDTDPALVRRWRIAAAVATGVDVAAFAALNALGVALEFAQAGAFAIAMLAAIGTLLGSMARPLPWATLFFVMALAYPLRAGLLALVGAHLPLLVAIVPAALAGALTLLLGGTALADGVRRQDFAVAAPLAIAYLLVLRLVYLGQIELAPQEAYYWNYSQHLDIGYLDHPPLVAWLIAGSSALGDGEFFVRLPAVLAWVVMVCFVVGFAQDMAGRGNALRSALLAATLPFCFGIGVMITPDAPLAAAWAAALFFLQRALLGEKMAAWLGAGLAIGIGMLAKYTMLLVPAAAFVFMLVDARARRALLSPWAWSGGVVALLVFSPVVVWNIQHDWASFAFQGSRRLAARATQFSLHEFLGYASVLLTPLGVLALWRLLSPGGGMTANFQAAPSRDEAALLAGRRRVFMLVFTLVPLLVFALSSIRAETKFHWTGPIWLAVLPMLAATMSPPGLGDGRLDRLLVRSWMPLLHVLILIYAYGLFYYPLWGLAGLRAHHHYLEMGWRDLRAQVQQIEESVLRESGRRPAVVGLDKHNTADEMAFYDPRGDGAHDTASRHLFDNEDAVMYKYWFAPASYTGRDLIVVSDWRDNVEDWRVAASATRLGPVQVLTAKKGGVAVGTYYARVVYGYRPPAWLR